MSQFISYGLGGAGLKITDVESNKTEVIGAGGMMTTPTKLVENYLITSDGGMKIASITPFGTTAPTYDGTEITLIGGDYLNFVKILDNDANYGCILNGDCILYKYGSLTLKWNLTLLRYVELSRNQVGL